MHIRILALLLFLPAAVAAQVPTSDDLLDRSIAYHDPNGLFLSESLCLSFLETRPDAEDRETMILVDVARQWFELARADERAITGDVTPHVCNMWLEGDHELSDGERQELGLSCERIQRMRDYYVYLWGLPMKLRDPGTILGEVETTTFMGRPVHGLRVTYDPEVGGDTWYFYFDRNSAALVGYRFYHDEEENDGEYIVLAGEYGGELGGELEDEGMRLPQSRTWYTHQDDRLLGTDRLERMYRCDGEIFAKIAKLMFERH